MEKKTRRKRGRKSNMVEFEARIPHLMRMILIEKLSYNEFITRAGDLYDVTNKTAGEWWSEIRKRLKERYTQESEEIIQDQLQRYFNLYDLAEKRGNTRVCREVLADITKIYGIEAASKIDVTTDGQPIKINIILDSK